ncbi:MAG TPA: hypothetical protein VIP70_02095 [Nitrososphaeraceae archaeon]
MTLRYMTAPCYFCGVPSVKTVHTGNGSIDVCSEYLLDDDD